MESTSFGELEDSKVAKTTVGRFRQDSLKVAPGSQVNFDAGVLAEGEGDEPVVPRSRHAIDDEGSDPLGSSFVAWPAAAAGESEGS